MGVVQEQYFKYKQFVFIMWLTGMIITVSGLFYFYNMFFVFSTVILIFYLFVISTMAAGCIINYFKFIKIMSERQKYDFSKMNDLSTHVFVVPSFKEDVEILTQTLSFLANHPYAKTYVVFMAMEERENGCVQKFLKLQQQFQNSFRILSYTLHQWQEGEAKSKNSNINWCTTHCVPTLLENKINLDDVFITIIDADSLVPYIYMDQVNKHISENFEKRHKFMYQPSQIFTRNDREVYFFVRLSDIIMSYMHTSKLYSHFNWTFGVSNYTTSYRHLEKIGFWDTCEFSRTEDLRIISKSHWKTEGDFYAIPISTPFNQISLKTGNGAIEDLKARFNQAIRHNLSQIQASYGIVSFLKSKKTLKDYYVILMILEPYFCVSIIPIAFISGFLQHIIKVVPHSESDDGTFFLIYNVINIILFLTAFPFYEATKRKITKEIYNLENMNIIHLFSLPFIVSPIAIFIGFIPLIIAGFRLTIGMKYQHQVTPKNIKDGKQKDSFLLPIEPEEVSISTSNEQND